MPTRPPGPCERNLPDVYRRLGADVLREALRKMHLIRRFEEGAEQAYMRGLIHGTMHLSIGQEASAVGICMPLTDADYITSTHRGHGHCIAKGADVGRMFAEFFGKEDGYCHVAAAARCTSPDVAPGQPRRQRHRRRRPADRGGGGAGGHAPARSAARWWVCFFGDGASNEGAFHEALNMAASMWKLPVVFVCENNRYGMSTSTERSMSVRQRRRPGGGLRHPGVIVDGNELRRRGGEASFEAVERARAGGSVRR